VQSGGFRIQIKGRSVASLDQNEGFRIELINLILRRLFGWIPVQLDFSYKILMFLWPPKKHAKTGRTLPYIESELKVLASVWKGASSSFESEGFRLESDAYPLTRQRPQIKWSVRNTRIRTTRIGCIDFDQYKLLTIPSNYTSNNIETQYNVQPNRVSKKPPPGSWLLPDFKPLDISCIFLGTAILMHWFDW
jgi:hypothetical protein